MTLKLPRLAPAGTVRPGRVSPMLSVPEDIPRPDYAESGVPNRRPEPRVKSPDVIARMRRTCRLAAEVLAKTGEHVAPGVTTDELDRIAHQLYLEAGAYPSTLNYHGYPKSLCTSVNEVICHGIPDSRALREGDIVNLDITAYREGVHGDCSATFYVGEPTPEVRQLVEVTRACLTRGVQAVKPGRPISDIGRAIEEHAAAHQYGVVRTFVAHGIGEQFHTDLQIPHYYTRGANTIMEAGMTFTVEPMICLGAPEEDIWSDGWTAVTKDRKPSAQFEHTVLVTPRGVEVLTEL
ncbi:MAG: type I methionyl aminopeptidase [Acidimicrobiales bacterium]